MTEMSNKDSKKSPVKIRFKAMKDGRRSIYLDCYHNGHRSYEYLKLYLVPETDDTSLRRNEAAMLKAMAHATIVGTESGRVGYLSAKHYTLPHSQRQVFIPDMLYEEESPALPRTADGRLLPDIPYPFLVDRRLGVEDCLKIIELNKERR